MIITFTTEDGTRTGEIVDSPRLPELNADGLHVVVRENGEFLGSVPIGSDASLYEVETRIRQMKSNDPEHLSNGRSVDASLVETGCHVWMNGSWTPVDYWKHGDDGSVMLNSTWFAAGERVLVHTNPELIRQEKRLVSRAVVANMNGNMDEFPVRVQAKVKRMAEHRAPKASTGHSRLPRHRTPTA